MSQAGLDGVVAAETRLSRVDGLRGELVIAGSRVQELAELSFAELAARLWEREDELARSLGAARVAAFEQLARWEPALQLPTAMDALRAGLALLELPPADPELALTGASAVLVGAWARRQAGSAPLAPDPDAAHAADLLGLIRGERATEAEARALNTYLVSVADHGLNASTFTARIVASTQADARAAVVAAIGALQGPLHGGAPGPVLDMLDAIGTPERAEAWLEAELAQGRRLMGFGHRVYRVRDPRASVLEGALLELCGERKRTALARSVEASATRLLAARYPQRPLLANVEFFTALLLEGLGIPRELFSAVFATGRVAGWLGHVAEQRSCGRLIRPRGRYVGPEPLPLAS